jgi:hypothetical protein
VKHIYDSEAPDIDQHDVAADELVTAVGRRRRQSPLKVFRATLHLLAETRRQCAPRLKLPFQSRRQLVALGQPGRQMVAMVAIPGPHLVAVAIVVAAVLFVPLVLIVTIPVPVVSIPVSVVIAIVMFVVTVAVPVPLHGKNGVGS